MRLLSALTLTTLIWMGQLCAAPPEKYEFLPLKDALRSASSESKPMLLYFGRYGCAICRKMHAEVFIDAGMRENYNTNFILAYVDIESGNRIRLANGERITRRERRLVGYRVTNTLSVTIRDLDNVGTIIDATVDAGGDATRLNSISFTVDDGIALEVQARTLALQDAVAKADLYASETGVSRGKLTSIVETSGNQFANQARTESASLAFDGAAPPTQILAGEFEVRVTVRAVFDID